jgi:hypothetical protein
LDIEGVIIFDSQSGIPLFSRLKGDVDPSLFSSFIAAVGHFSNEMKMGGLSSFTTEEKVIYLAARERIITALVAPKKPEYQLAYSLARELGRRFEEEHHSVIAAPSSSPISEYSEFQIVVDDFIRKIQHPFISRVAEFVHKKHGGEVSVKARMMLKHGNQAVIDIVVNLGMKIDEEDTGRKKRAASEMFQENFIFVKVRDGQMSRGEMIDFIDSIDGFGFITPGRDELVFVPYFPSRIIIVARDYSPEAIEFLQRLSKTDDEIYLDGSHVFLGQKIKSTHRHGEKCFVDIYRWTDEEEPTWFDPVSMKFE